MNKNEYLNKLEEALESARVGGRDEILAEYAEHFDRKTADGYSEEETAARLAAPGELAAQFADISPGGGRTSRPAVKIPLFIGVIFSDIFAAPFFILLCSWVVTLASLMVSSAVLGTALSIGTKSGKYLYIPQMPYICSLLLGITLLALTVIAAAGTEYCRLYITQLLRAYLRWHRRIFSASSRISPPMRKYPKICGKKLRIMRGMTLIALLVFITALTAAYISMFIASGSPEPWHVWHWFD